MMTRREWAIACLLGLNLPVRRGPLAGRVRQADPDALVSLAVNEMVRRATAGSTSPAALVDAHLARIDAADARLHAFITVTAEHARARAGALAKATGSKRGALFGVPIAHKDLFETAGVRTTAGSRLYDAHLPAKSAFLVAALERAGAISLGKTNTHELGGGVTTINPFFGTTRNPADPARIAGGSSGGSAAAVVACMAAGATGSDTGGSVRIPAALCGAVGFKPTFGRISTAGLLGSCPTFDHVGFLARSVADVRALYAAVRPVDRGTAAAGGSIRVGVARQFFFDGLQAEVGAAVDAAIRRIERLGATIVDRPLPVDGSTMARVFDPIVVSEIWASLGGRWRVAPDRFSPAFAGVFATPPPAAGEVSSARAALKRFQGEIDQALDGVDAVVMPTVPITAPLIDGPIDGMLILRNTWPMNAAGVPALSVPCHAEGALPVGLQIVTRRGHDARLLAMAEEWFRQP